MSKQRRDAQDSDKLILHYIKAGQASRAAAQASFEAAFELLHKEHADLIHRFFVLEKYVPKADVEDLTRAVFQGAWETMPNFRAESKITTWLLGIAKHKRADAIKKAKQSETAQTALSKISHRKTTTPAEVYEDDEALQKVRSRLEDCTLAERLVVLLRLHGSLTPLDIAKVLRIQPASLRQKYRRILIKLKNG